MLVTGGVLVGSFVVFICVLYALPVGVIKSYDDVSDDIILAHMAELIVCVCVRGCVCACVNQGGTNRNR